MAPCRSARRRNLSASSSTHPLPICLSLRTGATRSLAVARSASTTVLPLIQPPLQPTRLCTLTSRTGRKPLGAFQVLKGRQEPDTSMASQNPSTGHSHRCGLDGHAAGRGRHGQLAERDWRKDHRRVRTISRLARRLLTRALGRVCVCRYCEPTAVACQSWRRELT